MSERLTDDGIQSIIDVGFPALEQKLAREVQQWRARYGSLDDAFTVDELKQIYANQERLRALNALIPEVIEQLEAMRADDAASIGMSKMTPRFNAIIARLREASQ